MLLVESRTRQHSAASTALHSLASAGRGVGSPPVTPTARPPVMWTLCAPRSKRAHLGGPNSCVVRQSAIPLRSSQPSGCLGHRSVLAGGTVRRQPMIAVGHAPRPWHA